MFRSRIDAARKLARLLEHYRSQDVVVLGLPRGGVPVAYVARALEAPLDVIVVRKLGVPYQPELAFIESAHPFSTPTTVVPAAEALVTAPRIAALSPEQSPPRLAGQSAS